MECDSQIVIGPDGVVLAATGEVPPGLVDLHLDQCEALSREIRDAGRTLLQQLRHSGARVASRSLALADAGQRVQLMAIEAVVVRRVATDVRTLLDSKLAVIASQAEAADVALGIFVDDGVPVILHVDSEKVAWAVTTLVGNALRYVQAGSRRMSAGRITVRAAFDATAGELSIAVRDDGPGIPADTVARLLRRDGLNVRGAGLALLLMSDLCVAHGGIIDVRSQIAGSDHGTTVRLTFAASPQEI